MSELLNDFEQRYGDLYKEMELVLTQTGKSAELHLSADSISDGRLRFISAANFTVADDAYLAVQFFGRSFDVEVSLLSCEPKADLYKLELKITAEIALKARILLQLAEIVHYRKLQQKQGRELTVDEAASEWIGQFAAGFAEEFDKHINTP